MVVFTFEFEDGKRYARAFDVSIKKMKDQDSLYKHIVAMLEGRLLKIGKKTVTVKSPIEQIFETQGAIIGANWEATERTWQMKLAAWQDDREVDLPAQFNKPMWQISSGRQLKSLLDSGAEGAIRSVSDKLEFGTRVPYASKNQELFEILEFFPDMERKIDRVIVAWIDDIFQGVK